MTPRQEQLLDFIEAEQLAGRSPSVQEMQRHLDVASRSNVARLLDALEEGGFIERRRQRARSVVSRRLSLQQAVRKLAARVERRRDGYVAVPEEDLDRCLQLLPAPHTTNRKETSHG